MIRHTRQLSSIVLLSAVVAACSSGVSSPNASLDDNSGAENSAESMASDAKPTIEGVKVIEFNAKTNKQPDALGLPDADTDGVPDDRDLQPGTARGVPVNTDGIAAPANAVKSWASAEAVAEAAVTGEVQANGFMDIVVNAANKVPMVFRTLASNVQQVPKGLHVSGTLLVETPLGHVPILEANVDFERGAGSTDIETVRGRARVPFTDFGLSDTSISAPEAEFGLDVGANLKHINAPLNDDRRYLYFQFSDKLEIEAGPLTISAPGGQEHTVVVDPSDPFFFVRADLSGLGKVSDVLQNVGIGVSRQGLIPFTPVNTWGIKDLKDLKGHMFLDIKGSLKLPDLPVSLDGSGDTVLNIDPAGNGETIFRDPQNGLRLGANRQLDISLELIPDVASISLEVGRATFEADLLKSTQSAWLSGVLYPGKSVLGDVLGVIPTNEVKVAGYVSKTLSDSYFDMAGDSTLELSKLADLTGLKISDIPLGSGTFHVAKDGVAISGYTSASFLSSLGIDAHAKLDAKFPGNPNKNRNWFVNLDGALTVSGVELSKSSARLSADGVFLAGSWHSPLGQNVEMTGNITKSSFLVAGSADVTIPIATFDCTCKLPKMCNQDIYCQQARECSVANTCNIENTCSIPKTCSTPRSCSVPRSCSIANSCEVKCKITANPATWGSCFKSVTDAAVCGTKTVIDGAKCGYQTVTSGAQCGVETVTSSAKCGVDTVTNGAKCGFTAVTDASKCGTHIVRDAARCGTEAVKCGAEQVQCGTIDAAGAVCGTVCDNKVQRDLGKFIGHVKLSIGENGLRGEVEGDYVVGKTVKHVAGGRLDLTSTPKACITIPGGLGEFCANF